MACALLVTVVVSWGYLSRHGVADRTDRSREGTDKSSREDRRQELRREYGNVASQIRAREAALGRTNPNAEVVIVEADPEMKRLSSRLSSIETELRLLEEKR